MTQNTTQRSASKSKGIPLIGPLGRKLVHLLTRLTGTWVGSPND